MKHITSLFLAALLTPPAFAAIGHVAPASDAPAVYVAKDEGVEGRRCEIKGVTMHTKGNPHANEVAHRVIIDLRKPRGSYFECPASVAVGVESRLEAMQLFQLVKAAKKVVCQSSTVISGSHVNMTCDVSFEVRSEI